MSVLEPEGGLVDEIAGVGDRQRPPGLHQPGKVEAFDVFHGEDDAIGQSNAEYAVTIFACAPGDRPDFAEEPIHHAGLSMMCRPITFEHFVAAHELVVGQENHAHAAPAKLADDPVIWVVRKAPGATRA